MKNESQPFLNAQRYAYDFKKSQTEGYKFGDLPEGSGFLETAEVLCLPQKNGDSRYVYGENGFNFWSYASGYMHANEGNLSFIQRANEGGEPKVAFFATFVSDDNKTEVIPLLGIPESRDNATRFTVFNKSFVTYLTEYSGVQFAVRVFATKENKMSFTVTAQNNSGHSVNVYISGYINSFMLHCAYECGEDRWFREVKVMNDSKKNNLPPFVVQCNENISRTEQLRNFAVLLRQAESFDGAKLLQSEETTSRLGYVGGSRSSVNMPRSLEKGHFDPAQSVTSFSEVGICGDIVHWDMPDNSKVRQDWLLSGFPYKEWNEAPKDIYDIALNGQEIDAKLDEIVNEKPQSKFDFNFVQTADSPIMANSLNAFLDHVKTQVQFCALLKGYAQPGAGSLIGVRDVSQALEAYLMWEPKKAREKIIEVLSYTDETGRCPRQYSLPAHEGEIPAMDLRMFIDQGVWVISTIVTYLRWTNDFDFLNEECTYIQINDETGIKYSQKCDSVLMHMITIMDWLLAQIDEKTDCIRALFGDWNDALDGLGVSLDKSARFGSGVSTMATTQVWQNLGEMAELLKTLDSKSYADKIAEYETFANRIEKGLHKNAIVKNDKDESRICHGWGDKRSYIVGGFDDPDQESRISLTSHAFWILSGLYNNTPELKNMLINNLLSLDSKYGMITFKPGFEPEAVGVGRIPRLPIGTAENAAAYVHASLFGVMALFEIGDYKNAWAQLAKSLPFTHEQTSISPYVMPNSYGFNPQKNIDGQSMNDWQTGSSNVLLKLLMRGIIGVRPEYNGVWLRPATYCPFDGFDFEGVIKNAPFTFTFKKGLTSQSHLFVNDIEINQSESHIWTQKAYFIEEKAFTDKVNVVFVAGADCE